MIGHTVGDLDLLSIVSPVYNEERHIDEFIDRCLAFARRCPVGQFEIVLVDDGSQDRSRDRILSKAADHPGLVRLVELSRNFGQQPAYHAGLSSARGDIVVTLDSDLQDPPETIIGLVEKLKDGFDIVYARRVSARGSGRWGASGHTGLKALGAFVFHRLMSRVRTHQIPADVGEFRCMRRRVVEHLLNFSESMVFLPGLVAYVGFRTGFHDYVRQRRSDRAPTTVRGLVMRAVDALTTFSITPIVLFLAIAAAAWVVPLLIGVVLVAQAVFARRQPSLMALAVLASAVAWCVTLSALAVVAHYVGRIFIEVKRRPRYIVKEGAEKPDVAAER